MTITEQLENIILKYKLDRAYPRFKNYVKCKKLTKELFSKYTGKDKVLLLSSEEDSLSFALQEIDISCNLEKQVVDVLNFEKFDSMNFSIYSDVIVLSNDFYKEISYELFLRKVKHKCLYDCFAKNGLFLDYNYYNIFGGKYMPFGFRDDGTNYSFKSMNPSYELFYCYKKHILSQERELKQFYLQRIVFLSLYTRDFIAMDMHINTYINNKYDGYKSYKESLKSIEKLLNGIKFKLSARKDDCMVFLNDAMDYGNTPFLNNISKNSLHFENAYTPTPYTTQSFKSLMTGKLTIDDRAFAMSFKDNLIENLCKEHQMLFKYFGILNFEQSVMPHTVPASGIYWRAIEFLLNSKQQKFIFMHTLIETHAPHCANNLINLRNIDSSTYDLSGNHKPQQEISTLYADKQLQWYNKLFSQNSTKIYMNDHGQLYPQSVHTRLDISAPWIKPKKLNGIFSYLDFHKLVSMLLNKNLENLDDLFLDYAKIQDLPAYARATKKLMRGFSLPSTLFGYRGVVTKQAIYIKCGDGKEYYQNNRISKHRFSEKELKRLSYLSGNNFLDYNKEEKLKLSKVSYEILEKYNKRNGLYEKKKSRAFVNLLRNIPKDDIVAIRSGGFATIELLLKLGVNQQNRISFIIDKNPQCPGAYFGIPVISPQKAKRTKIDVIIAPQSEKDISQEVKKELLEFSKTSTVIDVYSYLASKGIVCTRRFYEREVTEEDFIS